MGDKWGRRFFKAGAVVLVLFGIVHSLSLVEKIVPANDTERQLLDLMTSYKFNLAGSMRSMDDLLRGFSICFIVGLVGLGGLDLTLAGERTELVRRLALINVLWLGAMTAVSLRYFFIAPTSFFVAGLLFFLAAWVRLRASCAS